ncbi:MULTISPECIES: signal peptidase II [unclassified Arthrobacter]|uniref:signal peptidase II n=1 Tax=unclassified Arthrobacter TaxID=235627 RepID=UPI00159DF7D7|nr:MULTISPECIES: signal peptidase II [unclassified Arthrobacter]MCQ9164254.1 signal peptidase II [Arthrobacter sp. STN4]NVN00203.1 signal peptidase II [Arthrobacter sp. SDTb3-6]
MSDDSPQKPATNAHASRNPGDTPGTEPATAAGVRALPRRRGLLAVWLGFAALAYVCDQLTKLWVTSTMVEGQRTTVIPGVLQWYYIRNSGAAFSIGEGFTWFFTLVMAAVAAFIIIFLAKRIGSFWWALGLGLLLGGSLGNLTDRLFRAPSFGMGHVVDFISFPHFAIFNMADMGVVGGVIAICLLTLIGVPLGGRRDNTDRDPGEPGPQLDAGETGND